MFDFIMLFMGIFILTAVGILIYTLVKNIRQWQRNNASPVQTVPAKIVSKRFDVQHFAQGGGQNQAGTSTAQTTYFVTFEFENGQRLEFRVKNKEFGLLVEGDVGTLTYQGTRYQGFARK